MRMLEDQTGQRWSVDVLAASYGVCYLVFSAAGAGSVRKAPLAADSRLEGARVLAQMTETALLAALAESTDFAEHSALGF